MASPHQKSSGFVQAAWSYVYTKIVVLFFLSIMPASWVAQRHRVFVKLKDWLSQLSFPPAFMIVGYI